MTSRTPRPGAVLRGDDGEALVVTEGADPIGALIELVNESYGGPPFARDNPVIVEAAQGLKVEVWRSCTAAYCEAEGIDTDGYDGWWTPDGDGKRKIHVLNYEGDVYDLGERAEEAEPT